ncbi:MAG: thiol-disulfide oxidoreductase DCC family protein [Chitinophagaceae bacterium]|nr:MAG: thiol-disulfide oxidoreductase DCC family protein [Chitinophagaceae bacterium]
MESSRVIFFDGVCNLCNASVQMVIVNDPGSKFKFAPLQSEFASGELRKHGIDPEKLDSIVLLENGRVYTKSSAALRVARQLKGAWPVLYGFWIIPKAVRDILYNLVARYRYRIWGKQESCWIPTAELKSRFL